MAPWALGIWPAFGVGILGTVVLGLTLGWRWGLGLLWGIGVIAVGRWLAWQYLLWIPRGRAFGPWVGTMGGIRVLIYGALAVLGIALGLSPLSICGGMLLPGLMLRFELLFWGPPW